MAADPLWSNFIARAWAIQDEVKRVKFDSEAKDVEIAQKIEGILLEIGFERQRRDAQLRDLYRRAGEIEKEIRAKQPAAELPAKRESS